MRPSRERDRRLRDRRLLDTMPQCIWAADAEGRVNYWNRAGLEYCGLDAASLTDGSFWEMLHVDDRAEARVHWERGLRGEPTFERQVRLRRASDGLFRWHLVRAVAERDDAGAVLGWIATATDIDDQKKAEDLLREAVHLRDDFLSVASHELRTPLTALKLEVSNLLRLARLDAGSERARLIAKVEKIDAQTARLRGLIDDLLDVSSLAAGQLELQIAPVDLAEVAGEVGARFIDEAARLGSTLTIDARERADRLLGSRAARAGGVESDLERGQVRRRQTDRRRASGRRGGTRGSSSAIRGSASRPATRSGSSAGSSAPPTAGTSGGSASGSGSSSRSSTCSAAPSACESAPGAGSIFTVELPYAALAQRIAWRAKPQEAPIAARAAAPSSTCTVVRGARTLPSAAAEPIAAPSPSPKRWA